MLDKGGAVKKFVDALQQLTNPDMIFKVKSSAMNSACFGPVIYSTVFVWFKQDWWDDVKNELEKPSFNRERMGDMYDEMHSSLGDRAADGHGMFRKKFIQVCGFGLIVQLTLESMYFSFSHRDIKF